MIDSWIFYIFTICIGAIASLILFLKRIYSYWDRNGYKSAKDVSFLFGHLKQAFLVKESFVENIDNIYRNTDEPFIGIYTIFAPILLVRDPKLIHAILVNDFSYFTDRGGKWQFC